MWKGVKKFFGATDKSLGKAADLYDNNDMPTAKGNVVEQAISHAPFEAASHTSNFLHGASEVGKTVKAGKSIKLPVVPIYKYATAHDQTLEKIERQNNLARKRARIWHIASAKSKLASKKEADVKRRAEKRETERLRRTSTKGFRPR